MPCDGGPCGNGPVRRCQVGKVADNLEATGEMDNTFVCFMSRNGLTQESERV